MKIDGIRQVFSTILVWCTLEKIPHVFFPLTPIWSRTMLARCERSELPSTYSLSNRLSKSVKHQLLDFLPAALFHVFNNGPEASMFAASRVMLFLQLYYLHNLLPPTAYFIFPLAPQKQQFFFLLIKTPHSGISWLNLFFLTKLFVIWLHNYFKCWGLNIYLFKLFAIFIK